ncbi:arginine--tRNA ligase [Paenibacillus sp. CN-4]|uniref:arginine--tRNA ligase n=1 Tax=Paenibacillus nanchangensis TaxID=3348343 RepID=UPI00397B0498
MISETLVKEIEQSVKQLLDGVAPDQTNKFTVRVEQPAHIEHGDYSTNIAMQLAKLLRKPPVQIAQMLKNTLEQRGHFGGLVARIEVAPPGFLNLYVNWNRWAVSEFAWPSIGENRKAVIEHTSINPNKSAHIGHLRNACIGDSLARFMKKAGYRVEVHNYIDDLGNQLADTVVGLLNTTHQGEHARFGDFCWDVYSRVNKQYAETPVLLEQRTQVLHSLEEGKGNLAWIGLIAAERIVREHLEEMGEFGITYDLLVWESGIVGEGFWDAAFDLLKQTSHVVRMDSGKQAGCWVLRQPSTGPDRDGGSGEDEHNQDEHKQDEHKQGVHKQGVHSQNEHSQNVQKQDEHKQDEHSQDKVLVRSNGILTYTAKDIAYHLWKFGVLGKDFKYKSFAEDLWTTHRSGTAAAFGGADRVINVIDHRQEYPQAMVKQALEVLGYAEQADNLRHVGYGVVSLSPGTAAELGIDTSDGRASYAMSGRQGIGIKIAELLDRMERIIEDKRPDRDGLSSRVMAAAAIRYYLLRYSLLTEVVFDLQQATEVTGNTGVYLMYSYARSAGILKKAAGDSAGEHGAGAENASTGVLHVKWRTPAENEPLEKAEYGLLRQLAAWQDTLYTACVDLTPSIICNYAYELATLFNNFYAACPILKADEDTQALRLWLTAKFQETLGEALSVLGLPAPERV